MPGPTTTHGDGLAALLRQYLDSRGQPGSSSFLEFVRRRNPHVFGHHDCTQADYLDHVWHCGGLHFCRGCTAVIAASAASLAIGLATRWPAAVSTGTVAAIFAGLLLLSLVPLPSARRTILHDLRRLALGTLLGSAATYLIVADDWLPRLVVVGVYVAVMVARRIVKAPRR